LVSAEHLPGYAPKGKSKTLAVLLALVFGPLGLIYVGAWRPALKLIAAGMPFVLLDKGGLWLTFGSRIIGAAWAYHKVIEQDTAPNIDRDSIRLLDEAARLENFDRAQAIAVYEEIIQQYPETSASKEAARNIETLKGLKTAQNHLPKVTIIR
jgi:hypothetical protein